MSGIKSITYRTIVDLVKKFIKENCSNITNYSGINASFKNGYTKTYTLDGGNSAATSYYTDTLTANGVSEVSTSTVDTDMNNFLNTIGLTNLLDNNITDSEFLDFINNIIIFASTKMTFRVSQLAQSTIYLVYDTDNKTYSNTEMIEKGHMYKIIEASDAIEIFENLFNIISLLL